LGSVVHEVGYDLSKHVVEVIVDFFMTNLVTNKIPRNLLKEEEISYEDIEKGKEIYLEKGCHACHQIFEEGGAVGPPLTSAGLRLIPGYVYQYLLDPKITNTKVVMPNLGLSKEEALNLTKFIMSLKGKSTK
jgi:mono/diheme cytochrome c family protein